MRGLCLGLPILLELGECWTCVWVAVVRGEDWVWSLDHGMEGWCYVCMSCEAGFSV